MFNFNGKFEWFPKWMEENPTNMFGPAIYVGVAGSVVFAAALVIAIGNPFQTTSIQTGPRGTGMHVPDFIADLEKGDPTIEEYYTEEAYVPEGEPLMKDIADYENIQVLGDLTEDNFNRLMAAITQWVSPDEGCAYCHGEEGDFASDDLYTKVVSRKMIEMTQNINENWSDHVAPAGVNCYTCHRGENVPSEIWFNISPVNENVSGWSANQNRATRLTQSTSLPADALQTYLVEYGQISVHDLESRVDNEGTASIQDTERTYSLMNYFANSLGANCVFCHNTRAFYDNEQVTPQWERAMAGIGMVLELNNDYLDPLQDTYPETRLGPVHGDAPKAACKTCHKGQTKPMLGTDMITDWPELAVSGEPTYE